MNRQIKEKRTGIPEKASYLFVILMIGVFPLLYRNNYIDIMIVKLDFFRFSALCCLVIVILSQIVTRIFKKESLVSPIQRLSHSMSRPEYIFALIFALSAAMSAILATDSREAWLGTQGRMLGAALLLLCVAVYAVTSCYFHPGNEIIWVFLISNMLVFLLAILNFWGIDPLNMYSNLIAEQHDIFISTIGNTNITANYFCLVIPIGMTLYYFCENSLSKILYSIFLLLGFYASYATSSDSWILGYGAAFLVFFWYSLKDHRRVKKFLNLCLLFYVASCTIKLTVHASVASGLHTPLLQAFLKPSIAKLLIQPVILIVTGFILIGIYLFVCYMQKKNIRFPYLPLRKWIFSILGIIALTGISALLAANINPDEYTGVLSFLNRFRISDSFGTNRGYIWKRTCAAYGKLPLSQKLFGCGANCFQQFIDAQYGEEIRRLYVNSFIDAHSEFLQFLATTGIVGVSGYFGLLVSMVVKTVQKSSYNPVMIMGTVTIASYLAQGLVNNPQIFTTTELFVFLGILNAMGKSPSHSSTS